MSDATTPEVVCVGEAMILLVPDDSRSLANAERLLVSVGGAESNVAAYLAMLGIAARWHSRVGDDPLGRRLEAYLADVGVDTSTVERDPSRATGVYFKNPIEGEPTAVYYYRSDSAATALTWESIESALASTTQLIHTSGVTAAISKECAEALARMLTAARRLPLEVSFDVNYRPGLWPTRDEASRVLRNLAAGADIVFVGLDEANALWGTTTPRDVRTVLPSPSTLVVKAASEGATVFCGDTVIASPALRVDVIEPVGAGDAFAAGFLGAMVRGEDIPLALRHGHLLAAESLRSPFDVAMTLSPDEREALVGVPGEEWASTRIFLDADMRERDHAAP